MKKHKYVTKRISIWRDWTEKQHVIHILPSIDMFWNEVDGDIQISWLIWTLEITFRDR